MVESSAKEWVIKVKGQETTMPKLGLGTMALGEHTVDTVAHALQNGYKLLDAALLYDNQKEVGEGIRKSGVARDQIYVISKVAFFPENSAGCWMHNPNNEKGGEEASIDLCLKELGLDYIDLMLAHDPCVSVAEYSAAGCPHFFELFNHNGHPDAVKPEKLPNGESVRDLIIQAKLDSHAKNKISNEASLAQRKKTWAALEKAYKEGKVKAIGVSNYPGALIREMQSYAEIMPCVNEFEYQPKFQSPETHAVCKELGIRVMAYGNAQYVLIKNSMSPVIADIAKRLGRTPMQVVLRWIVQNGVIALPRTKSPDHLAENLAVVDESMALSAEDMAAIDALEENHPHYWLPEAILQTI